MNLRVVYFPVKHSFLYNERRYRPVVIRSTYFLGIGVGCFDPDLLAQLSASTDQRIDLPRGSDDYVK